MKQKQVFRKNGLIILLLCWGIVSFAQNRTINGKVTELTGGTLPGVTVSAKGTTTGTITDVNGYYSLTLSANVKTLVFSFVGMKTTEVQVGASSSINITLSPDMVSVDEVVVVGYGTQKKSDITGSVVSLKNEVLESKPQINLEQMLQGTMAGMTVTVDGSSAEKSSNTMLIRGINSITASNSPLIILDGIPFSGNLSELNPKDIESIEVLKDASSAAIYGSRGSNGVILITSKKGKAGEMRVNYVGSFSIDQVVNVPDLMDGKTFYETKTARGLTTTAIEDEGYQSGRSTDWVDLATQTGSSQQHNLSFMGGSEKTKYFISMAYVNSEGIAIGDNFKRYTFRINLDHKILPWITFSTNTQYGYYDRSGNSANFSTAFTMNPLGIPYNDDGSIRMETWEDGVYAANPLLNLLNENSNITRRFSTNNNLLFDFPFVKGLTYNFNTGYDFRSSLNQTYRGRNTLTGKKVKGSLDSDNGYQENWIIENILTYKKEFDRHSLFLTGLYSAQSEWAENHNIHAEGFPNDVMTYYQANKANLIEPSDSYRKVTHLSQMLRANYGFDSRYLLTLTVRRDGYSAFGEDSKFGLFPSAAVGWNITKERFMKDVKEINVLKLRLSYGVNGNEAVSSYSTLPSLSSYDFVDGSDGTLFGFYPSRLGDPSLGWETTTSFNTGVDFGLFNNRLKGLVDVYWSRTTDLLLSKSISNVNGTGSIIQNIGETANNGFEIQLSSVNIHKSKFKWTTDFNISHYNSKIVNVGLTDEEGNYIDDVDSRWFIGEPVVVNYDYVFDGIYQENMKATPQGDVVAGDIKYLNANASDNVITPDDKQIIGRRIPDFVAGMTNTFQYKNWTFSFFLNSVMGITKANDLLYTNDNDMRLNRYNVTFWTAENQSNVYPRNDRHASINKFSMPFYRNSDFLRLQDISLSYRVPDQVAKKLKLKNVEVFTNIKNLATWTNWVGLDPEFSDQAAVPQTSTYLFGVKIGL